MVCWLTHFLFYLLQRGTTDKAAPSRGLQLTIFAGSSSLHSVSWIRGSNVCSFKRKGDRWGWSREGGRCAPGTGWHSTSGVGSMGTSAGFPTREAGHYDSAGARACDQRHPFIFWRGEGVVVAAMNWEASGQRGRNVCVPCFCKPYDVLKNPFPSSKAISGIRILARNWLTTMCLRIEDPSDREATPCCLLIKF